MTDKPTGNYSDDNVSLRYVLAAARGDIMYEPGQTCRGEPKRPLPGVVAGRTGVFVAVLVVWTMVCVLMALCFTVFP